MRCRALSHPARVRESQCSRNPRNESDPERRTPRGCVNRNMIGSGALVVTTCRAPRERVNRNAQLQDSTQHHVAPPCGCVNRNSAAPTIGACSTVAPCAGA